jgi:hypothetical protein
MRPWLLTCSAIWLTAASCSSSSPAGGGPRDAASDIAPRDIAPRDATSSDTVSDAGRIGDAAVDTATCPSVDVFCAADGGPGGPASFLGTRCVRDWSTATTPAAWCPTNLNVGVYPGCNGYDIVVEGAVDTSVFYLYDLGTGNLVGVWYSAIGGFTCVAGDAPPVNLSGCYDGGRPPSICATDAGGG